MVKVRWTRKCCGASPSPSGAVCLTRGAFLWLGAERLFLSPARCERHKKEITSSQYFRKSLSEFTAAVSWHLNFFTQFFGGGAPGTVQHHRVRPRRVPYCFLRLYYQGRGNGFLKPRTRREAIRRRASPFLPPLPTFSASGSSLSAGVCPTATPATVACTVRSDTSLKFGPVSLSSGSLRSSFSLAYLRHSVSAQADYCPDVVGLLFCTAPFIAATIQQRQCCT